MFKDLFSQLLQERDLSAYKLSKATGMSEALISNWKSGRQLPKYDSIKVLCDYFGVSADYLLERETPGIIVSDVHGSFNVATQTQAPVTMGNTGESLSAQERDLLQIFRNASGKKQVEIMQYIYGMEEEA